jgi:ubiquinone/menaquinone biosynthesis C-methylase UbiE
MAAGTPETREFYDRVGWKRGSDSGQLEDLNLFGVKEDGPIRKEIWRHQLDRIQSRLRRAGESLNLLECGCGGNPMVHLLRNGDRYTGVDFSTTGLAEANQTLQLWGGTYRLQEADICRLPFSDCEFDTVYSAHVLYHIDNTAGQAAALLEIIRVLRPGGMAVLHLANPRPLLFPVRLGMRLVADTPVLWTFAKRLRKKRPALPYRPLSISWYQRRLQEYGTVEVMTGGIPSNWFNRNITETRYPTKILWQAIRFLDTHASYLSAWLGNYFLLIFCKKA